MDDGGRYIYSTVWNVRLDRWLHNAQLQELFDMHVNLFYEYKILYTVLNQVEIMKVQSK